MLKIKRGQISANVFIYVVAIIIVGVILAIGYKYISDAKERIDTIEFISLKNKLASDIETIGQDYGTFRKKSYSLPKLTELCLFDLNKKNAILESELINFYPLIKDSIQSDVKKNAFFVGKSTFEPFFIGDIEINHYPHFKCLKPAQGKIELGIEGKGDSALILSEFVASIKLNPSKEIDLKSSDDVVELIIPEGTTAEVEGTPVEEISIEIVDPTASIETGGKASDIYKFEPSGLVFSQPIELKIDFNPSTVGECPESLIFYQYNDDGSFKAAISSKEIDCENQIATFEIDSFSFGYIAGTGVVDEENFINEEKCIDGTSYNECSSTKPLYCQNGQLVEKASLCGCPDGHFPEGDSCVLSTTELIISLNSISYDPYISSINLDIAAENIDDQNLQEKYVFLIVGNYLLKPAQFIPSPTGPLISLNFYIPEDILNSITSDSKIVNFEVYFGNLTPDIEYFENVSVDQIRTDPNMIFVEEEKIELTPLIEVCPECVNPEPILWKGNGNHESVYDILVVAELTEQELIPYLDASFGNGDFSLFKTNPFIDKENLFNIFYVTIPSRDYSDSQMCEFATSSHTPNFDMVFNQLDWVDGKIYLSQNPRIWPHAGGGVHIKISVSCLNFGEINIFSRIMTHEFGHMFGLLKDEYGRNDFISYDFRNCAYIGDVRVISNKEIEELKNNWLNSPDNRWANIDDYENTLFQGCGSRYSFRSSDNSIMKCNFCISSQDWPHSWYPVNEYYLNQEIDSIIIPPQEECDLTSAQWEKTSAIEGERVRLIVNGENCNGVILNFTVWEDDIFDSDPVDINPESSIFINNEATSVWTAEWQGDVNGNPEYFFIALTGNDIKISDNRLNVNSRIICIDKTWEPDPSTVDERKVFTQTSNCGTTRKAVGTKTTTTPTYSWETGPYGGVCYAYCDGGKDFRIIFCKRDDGIIVKEIYCSKSSMPSKYRSCDLSCSAIGDACGLKQDELCCGDAATCNPKGFDNQIGTTSDCKDNCWGKSTTSKTEEILSS